MLRLYHTPRSRSERVLWLLEEAGGPYELTVLSREERQSAEHRRRHPLGHVPLLEDDTGFIHESAALCLHLADVHLDDGLNFELGTHERGLVYQWTVFAMAEVEPAAIAAVNNDHDPPRAAAATGRFREAANIIESALENADFLVGGRLTVADIVCGSVLFYAERSGLTSDLGVITAYIRRLQARPALQRAMTPASE